jgi:hypothetical protein
MKETRIKQPDIEGMPEWDDLMRRFLDRLPVEERLAGLAPDQVLGAFAPEQRLAGLATEQVVLALPLEVLRVLPEDYVRSLPVAVQQQIRLRLQGAAH